MSRYEPSDLEIATGQAKYESIQDKKDIKKENNNKIKEIENHRGKYLVNTEKIGDTTFIPYRKK